MLKRYFLAFALFSLLPAAVMAQEATPEATEEAAIELIELPVVDPLALEGDVITAGSSTVFPVSEAMAERFLEDGFAGEVTVDSIGSGGGFERFCVTGETDVANASRAIREGEIASCAEIDRTPIEFLIGIDALSVVVSTSNDFVTELSLEQLTAIFSGAATTWDQVDASFPAETIQIFSPGSDSGTFDYFVEVILLDALDNEETEENEAAAALLSVPGAQFSEDDNVLVQGIEASPYAIGYFGFAYYLENQAGLKAVSLDFGDGAIEPNAETAEDGSYPLARPLYIYTDAAILADKPQVAGFVGYYLANVNEVLAEVGYFPASAEATNIAREAYLAAIGE